MRTRVWLDRHGRNILNGRIVMGIINVTTDSFFDGSRTPSSGEAIARAAAIIDAGARMIDIGAESTRPGAEPVDAATELSRVIPLVREIRSRFPSILISIDTYKAAVAEESLAAGADIINDVSSLTFDKSMADVVSHSKAPVILMHMKGSPQTMQDDPAYADVVGEVSTYLNERIAHACARGVERERIVVDPGIGFGKTLTHNLALLKSLPQLKEATDRPVLVGLSRKRFIGDITGRATGERLAGSLGAAVAAAALGADIVRTHDVAETREALAVADAILKMKTA